MDHAGFQRESFEEPADEQEPRSAPRYSLFIRAAKLVSAHGEFVCVVRDVSATGASVRLFHLMPSAERYALELQTGQSFEVRRVWHKGIEAGFEFLQPIEVGEVINEASLFPKRGLRLAIQIPVTLATPTQGLLATIHNISQQGARLECDGLLAIDQGLHIRGPGLNATRAKVRWRREREYGLVFDDTFTLADFARLAARLQSPSLLSA